MLFYYLFCKKDFTFVLIFVIVYTERERKNKELAKGQAKEKKMKELKKFFSYDKDEGKIVLHPVNMGSDSWSLRTGDNRLLFSIDNFLEEGSVLLQDGAYVLNLVELDDYHCFSIKFVVKGRQIIIEDVVCRNAYKRGYLSIMPDKGIYTL